MKINKDNLQILWPILGEIAVRIIDGVAKGRSAAEIRRDISRDDIVSDEAIERVRSEEQKTADYIKNG